MAKTCSLDSLSTTGPYDQTLFLGCSIVSFTANTEWDAQSGSVTVQLIQDTCASSKVYYNNKGVRYQSVLADPGFIGESTDIIGCAVYFRLGSFEFAGLVQNWEKTMNPSGNPTYSVNIADPRQLLENAQIILNDYAGGVSSAFNVFNVFGYLESMGVSAPQLSLVGGAYTGGDLAPDGATFGSPAGGFGGAGVNGNGMLWGNLITGLNLLTSAIPRTVNQWSPYGRITYKATNSSGYGLLQYDRTYLANMGAYMETQYLTEYFLDLSELPTPPSYWRMEGNTKSILEFITTLCNDAGYNFYIELVLVPNASQMSPSGVGKFIKVRTVKRLTQPDLGVIADFIGSGVGSIDSRHGVELRNETTSSLCFGGQKETLYQLTGDNVNTDDYILPYIGLDAWTGNTLVPARDANDEWYFLVDTTLLNTNLNKLTVGTLIGGRKYAYITELELMAAIAGIDMWQAVVENLGIYDIVVAGTTFKQSSTGQALIASGNTGLFNLANLINAAIAELANPNQKKLVPEAAFAGLQGLKRDKRASRELEERELVYQWVLNLARNFGNTFQVRVPYTCARIDTDSAQILTSEQPTAGGWTEQNILGLSRTSPYIGFFKLEDNKISALVTFNDSDITTNPKDVSRLGDSYCILGDKIYVKANVQPEYVYENKLVATGPRAVLSIPGPLPLLSNSYPSDMAGLLILVDRELTRLVNPNKAALLKIIYTWWNQAGNKIYGRYFPYFYDTNPYGAACGIHSNIMTYGPWVHLGPAGGTRIEHDAGLVPWEYNGYTNMNLAGQSKADEGITRMRVSEVGDITVPGYPTIPLGAELGAVDGGIYGAGTNLLENRLHSLTTTSATFGSKLFAHYAGTGGWTGLYGPNITSVSVSVGVGSPVQTTYSMRTYSSKFGRFSKQNADRFKTINKLQTQMQKAYTQWLAPRIQGQFNEELRSGKRQPRITFADKGIPFHGATPNHVIIGSMVSEVSGFIRGQAVIEPLEDLGTELSGYANKAFMSLDALLCPVSLIGDGGLPRLSIPLSSSLTTTQSMMPPVSYTGGGGGSTYNLGIDNNQIQPLQNPDSEAVARAADSGVGHNILMLGRDDTVPEYITNYNIAGDITYASDYRFMALRGPLMLQSWGYDTQGKPVPNSGDSQADIGVFGSDNLTDKFAGNWLRKPDLWPVAPIDLRYDRQRGVWVSPPAHLMLVGQLSGTLTGGGSQVATLVGCPNVYDSNGALATGMFVTVINKLNHHYASGDKVYISYQNGEYFAIGGGGGSGNFTAQQLSGLCYTTGVYDGGINTNLSSMPLSFATLAVGPGLQGYIASGTGTGIGTNSGIIGGTLTLGLNVPIYGNTGTGLTSTLGVLNASYLSFGTGIRIERTGDCGVFLDITKMVITGLQYVESNHTLSYKRYTDTNWTPFCSGMPYRVLSGVSTGIWDGTTTGIIQHYYSGYMLPSCSALESGLVASFAQC